MYSGHGYLGGVMRPALTAKSPPGASVGFDRVTVPPGLTSTSTRSRMKPPCPSRWAITRRFRYRRRCCTYPSTDACLVRAIRYPGCDKRHTEDGYYPRQLRIEAAEDEEDDGLLVSIRRRPCKEGVGNSFMILS